MKSTATFKMVVIGMASALALQLLPSTKALALSYTDAVTHGGAYIIGETERQRNPVAKGLYISSSPVMTFLVLSLASVFGDKKVILAAQDDAQYFVATQGQYPTARLHQAFNLIRKNVQTPESDLEIAQAIIDAADPQ
jgi:uncharacterized protein (TIGR02448 family)